jgi:hypothetical protein
LGHRRRSASRTSPQKGALLIGFRAFGMLCASSCRSVAADELQ